MGPNKVEVAMVTTVTAIKALGRELERWQRKAWVTGGQDPTKVVEWSYSLEGLAVVTVTEFQGDYSVSVDGESLDNSEFEETAIAKVKALEILMDHTDLREWVTAHIEEVDNGR
jgi:hypothetical protein